MDSSELSVDATRPAVAGTHVGNAGRARGLALLQSSPCREHRDLCADAAADSAAVTLLLFFMVGIKQFLVGRVTSDSFP